MYGSLYVLLVSSLVGAVYTQTVTTSVGAFHGTTWESRFGDVIHGFRGIRYAQAPTGNLRFKAPVLIDSWGGDFNATADGPICPQPGDQSLMSEDCLFLNVFTKNISGSAPVMVYIHGGANVLGSGHSDYEAGPDYLLRHDVVMVSFNYRLGALGFLSTQSGEAPGNYGFLDQVTALNWVRLHIINFGGDPDLVTIFGMSAGAMAVTLHMASPLSKGLFHRAIAMSGSATNHYHIDNVAWTRKLAREVSCPMYTPKNVVDCLRNVSWSRIIEVCSQWEPYGFMNMKWNYEIDGHFLKEHPNDVFLKGEYNMVPLIAGISKNEFDFSVFVQENNTNLLDDIAANFDLYAPEMFLFNGSVAEERKFKADRIKSYYLGNRSDIAADNLQSFGEMFSDGIIGHGVNRLVHLASRYLHVFYYRLDYQSNFSLYTNAQGQPRGVCHADDLQYIMPSKWYAPIYDEQSLFMIQRITKWWTTFALYGIPFPEFAYQWEPAVPYNVTAIYNDRETKMGPEPYSERYKLWEELFPLARAAANYIQISSALGIFIAIVYKFLV